MNNAKFTPGPWEIKGTKNGPTYIGTVEECGDVPKSCHDWHAQVFESGITPHVPTWEASHERLRANAHLIAAAPDLYYYAEAEARVQELWEIGEACYRKERPQSDYWDALKTYFPAIEEQCPLHTSDYIVDWFGEAKSPEDARWELYYTAGDEDSASGMIHRHLIVLRTAALAKAQGGAK